MAFLPCVSCRRHVRDLDEACPFCGRARVAAAVDHARPRSRLSRGSMFAFASVAIAIGCSSESSTGSDPVVDSAVADTGVATDTAVKNDTEVNDTGSTEADSGTDSATSDTGASDSGESDTGGASDTGAEEDSRATPDDGGAAPLYGLPPPS